MKSNVPGGRHLVCESHSIHDVPGTQRMALMNGILVASRVSWEAADEVDAGAKVSIPRVYT
jgi:hypothetical protein